MNVAVNHIVLRKVKIVYNFAFLSAVGLNDSIAVKLTVSLHMLLSGPFFL